MEFPPSFLVLFYEWNRSINNGFRFFGIFSRNHFLGHSPHHGKPWSVLFLHDSLRHVFFIWFVSTLHTFVILIYLPVASSLRLLFPSFFLVFYLLSVFFSLTPSFFFHCSWWLVLSFLNFVQSTKEDQG